MNARSMVRAATHGFSLLELMLVLAIIGILMSVVAVNVLGAGDKAKNKASRASMETIKNALTNYNLTHSAYPPALATLQTTKELDASKPLKDGWGRDFVYNAQSANKERPFTLFSAGPDGNTGTDDDIDVWTMYENNK